jgi:hypothetical protein
MSLAEVDNQAFLASVADAVLAFNHTLVPVVMPGRDDQVAVVLRARFTANVLGTVWLDKDRLWTLREPLGGAEAQFENFTRPDFNPERGDKVTGLNNIAVAALIVIESMDDCARVLAASRIAPESFTAEEVDFAVTSLRRSIDMMSKIADNAISVPALRRPAADAARAGGLALEKHEQTH